MLADPRLPGRAPVLPWTRVCSQLQRTLAPAPCTRPGRESASPCCAQGVAVPGTRPPTAGRARIRCRPFSGCICAACLTLSSTERHAFPVVHAVGQVASLAQGEPAGGRTLSGRSLRKRRGSQQRGHAAWPPWAVGQALRRGPFPRVLSPSTATPRLAFRAVFHPCGVILAV